MEQGDDGDPPRGGSGLEDGGAGEDAAGWGWRRRVRGRERPARAAVPAEARQSAVQAVDAEAVREGAAQRRGEDGDGLPVQVL